MLQIGRSTLQTLAEEHGTPLYIFDETTIRNAARAFKRGMADYKGGASVFYAAKALLNSAIVRLMQEEGLHLDVVSLNELAIAQHAEFDDRSAEQTIGD